MTVAGDLFVECCLRLKGIPHYLLCIAIVIIQGTLFNIYLHYWMGPLWLSWFAYDVVNVGVFVSAFLVSRRLNEKHKQGQALKSIGWLAWLLLQVGVAIRMLVGFLNFATLLEEDTFLGPSTFLFTIALSSAIFVLLLTAHYDFKPGTATSDYIGELTGSVVIDLIDTVDAVEVLFTTDSVEDFYTGLKTAILFFACFNLLLPTIPFITLSLTEFGKKKMTKRLVAAHKALVSIAFNLPNLILRLILWHGFSVGISVFVLKNVINISLTTYGFYQHKMEKYDLHNNEFPRESNPIEEKQHDIHRKAGIDSKEGNEYVLPSFALEGGSNIFVGADDWV